MKKYLVFIVSFALLYIIFQIFSGWILTALYTPDLTSMGGNLSQEVVFGQTSTLHLLATILIATLAYFLSRKLVKTTS